MSRKNLKGLVVEVKNDGIIILTAKCQFWYTRIGYYSNSSNVQVGDFVNYNLVESLTQTEISNLTKCYFIHTNQFIILPNTNNNLHIDIDNLLPEILDSRKLKLKDDYIVYTHDFEREVGFSKLVETSEEDNIIYAKYKKSNIYNKFVKDKNLISTNKVTLILKKISKDSYLLLTAYYGDEAKMSIYDPKSDKSSVDFWKNKALIYEEEKINLKSITTKPIKKTKKTKPKTFKEEVLSFISKYRYIRGSILSEELIQELFETKFQNYNMEYSFFEDSHTFSKISFLTYSSVEDVRISQEWQMHYQNINGKILFKIVYISYYYAIGAECESLIEYINHSICNHIDDIFFVDCY